MKYLRKMKLYLLKHALSMYYIMFVICCSKVAAFYSSKESDENKIFFEEYRTTHKEL